jgi:hypothetical protein
VNTVATRQLRNRASAPAARAVSSPRRRPLRNDAQPRLAAFIRDYLPAISVVGLVLYGLFRLAYSFFYIQLRTTPEEVGYNYTRIIAESIVGAIELILICAVLIAVVAAVLAGGWIAVKAVRRRRWPGITDMRQVFERRKLTRAIKRIIALAVAAVFLSLPWLAWWQGGLAQAGQVVRNVYFIGVPYLPVLAVQAVPATVTWKAAESEKAVPLKDRTCLLYLGRGDSTAVFYDVGNRDSLRLPTGDITVTLRYEYFVPDACRAAARKLAAAD